MDRSQPPRLTCAAGPAPQPAGSRSFLLATSWGGARPCGPFAFLRPRARRAVAAARPLPFPPVPAWSSPGLGAARDPKQPWGRPGLLWPSPTPHSPPAIARSGFLGPPVSLHLAFLHWPPGASQRPCVLKVGLT